MLNKDEYNQDEYNDYYAQETRGAEISGRDANDGGSKRGILLALLLVIVAVGGYFGWKSMDSSEVTGTDLNQTVSKNKLEGIEEDSTKIDTAQKEKITKEVEKSIASSDIKNGNMDPEDIANIIQMVMLKMNTDKSNEASSTDTENSESQVKDSQLMESLTDAKVDSLSSIDTNEVKTVLSEDTDIYNKVVLEEGKTNSSDELSRLSDEISNFINSEDISAPTTVDTDYTESITKEVKTREKEMRYYIVKKGDTLGKIAKRYYGNVMEFKKIQQANPDILRRPEKIHVGQKIRLP